MEAVLSLTEVRVLGSLLEKELLTPESYPLSLAGLTVACNQKSSREPVMTLDEAAVFDAVHSLMKKHMVRERSGAGSRVPKFAHRLAGTLDPVDELSQRQRAVMALLMLRGPQTLGELRTRSGRMYDFESLEEVDAVLLELGKRPKGAMVAELPRQSGQRERRFMQLLGGGEVPAASLEPGSGSVAAEIHERVAALEEEVSALRRELAELRGIVASLSQEE